MVPPAPTHSVIPWHRRLEARVLLSVTLIAGLSLAAVLAATSEVVNRVSLSRARDDLLAAREAFRRITDMHAEFAVRETQLIVELPVFRASLTDPNVASDTATITELTREYCRKLEAHFCIVTDAAGTWIGTTGWNESAGPTPVIHVAIQQTRNGRAFQEMVSIADELFLIISEPARFGTEVVGTLTAGYRLDDGVAEELSLVARCDVSFVCPGSQLCGTSLPAADSAALKQILKQSPALLGSTNAPPALRQIGNTSYVGGAVSFLVGEPGDAMADPPRLVLLQDVTPTEQALHDIQTALVWVGIVTFAVAVGGTLVLARRTTRPIRHLVDAANDVAAGNWNRRVPLGGPAEARTMATAFNHMTATLSHWHQEARERAQQLHESYMRFQAVTNSANDAIVSVNSQGAIVFWNLRAQTVFGYAEPDAVGQSLRRLIPERFLTEYADKIQQLIGGDTSSLGKTIELCALHRDGTEVPIELSLSTWMAGVEVFYTGIVRDITERKEAAEALRQREEQLRHAQKMEAIGRLAGGIAHDFNNLLTAILGYADLLLEELPADHPMRTDIEGIQKAGRSAASLTRELLAFSRKQVLQPVVLDMNEVVMSTEILLRRLLGEDINLVFQLEPQADPVKADRSQMEQVLLNLVVNARDAMPGGGELTIATSNVVFDNVGLAPNAPPASGPYVVLTVTDTGHGMNDDIRSHIFEPFFTTKEFGKGTGLGLATVYGIIEQSGGHIWVESEPGQGSSFHVGLPVVRATAAATDATAPVSPAAPKGSETILLVEDNDQVRALASDALTRHGYHVIEASNGEEALRLAEHQLDGIALVVTDVVMPVMGGRELASQLTARRPDLKIIFTSGYTTDVGVGQVGSHAATSFLQKPFTPGVLGRTVREMLDSAPA
jgi:PAS domain S-box-containing protein